MPSKGTSVKGIRLPDPIWERIDREAEALGMTRNEFLNRRFKTMFVPVLEVGNSVEPVHITDDAMFIPEEGDSR